MIRRFSLFIHHTLRRLLIAVVPMALLLAPPAIRAQDEVSHSTATATLKKLSSDTFTNSSSQHATEVEPDNFSFGSTIVNAIQVGRFGPPGGGASDIGFATSIDGGVTWTHGNLPGITNIQGAGNPYDRASDAAVAYDPLHGVWLIASLPIVNSGAPIPAVIVSRSTDGGLIWDNPVSVGGNVDSSDKDWIVCDTWTTSPFYGNCYVEWDNPFQGDFIYMSTSTDGGMTWGPALSPAGGKGFGLGGQPLVQPNGTVVVPFEGNGIQAFSSTNGGASWNGVVTVASISDHLEAGGLRSSPLPSAAVDGAGTIYVVWQDCRFRAGCSSNDIVMSTSTNGTTWTSVARIPEDPVTSTVDHFIPGIDADKTTSGSAAHLGLVYYSYPVSNCTLSTCRINAIFMSSANGGTTWSAPQRLAGGLQLSWLPNTQNGLMLADYLSVAYVNGKAFPVFAFASAKIGTRFNESMFTTASGLSMVEGAPTFSSAGDVAIPGAKSDYTARREQGERGVKPPPNK